MRLLLSLLSSFGLFASAPGGLTDYPTRIIGPNLLTNASFEQVAENGKPVGWSDNGFTSDNATARTGERSYRITDANTIPYAQSAGQKFATLRKGLYRFSAWVKLQDMAATVGSGVRVCFSVGAAWPYISSTCTPIVKGTADWQELALTTLVVPADGPGRLEFSCYGDPDGTAWFDDAELRREEMPLEVFLLYPNYRGMLFDDQSQVARFDLSVDPASGTTFADYQVRGAVMDETTGSVALQGTFPASADGSAQFDFVLLPGDRTYLVQFELVRTDASSVYKYPAYRIAKVDGALRQSMTFSFDEHNRILLRGQPTFLLGVYDSGLGYTTYEENWVNNLTNYRRLFELPINLYLNYWYGHAPNSSMIPLMNVLQRHGILFLQTANSVGPLTIEQAAGGDPFWWETQPMADLQVRAAHPGFGGVYVADESRGDMVQNVFAHRGRTLEADPDGITLATLFANTSLPLWRDAVDLLATDPYPLYGAEPEAGYKLSQVADWTRLTREAVRDSRPFLTVPQFFKFTASGRFPTQAELRNMSYMAIAEGANGLMYWSLGANALAYVCDGSTPEKSPSGSTSWCPYKVELFERLKAVMNELKGIEPALVSVDRPELLAGNTNPAIHTRVKLVGDTAYVIAYNESNALAATSFTMTRTPTEVTLHNESGTITVSENSFSGDFGPYAAHVYVVKLEAEVPPPPPPPPPACCVALQESVAELGATVADQEQRVADLNQRVAELSQRLLEIEQVLTKLRQALQ